MSVENFKERVTSVVEYMGDEDLREVARIAYEKVFKVTFPYTEAPVSFEEAYNHLLTCHGWLHGKLRTMKFLPKEKRNYAFTIADRELQSLWLDHNGGGMVPPDLERARDSAKLIDMRRRMREALRNGQSAHKVQIVDEALTPEALAEHDSLREYLEMHCPIICLLADGHTMSDVREFLCERLGRSKTTLSRGYMVAAMRDEACAYARATGEDPSVVWSRVEKVLDKTRGSRSPYKTGQQRKRPVEAIKSKRRRTQGKPALAVVKPQEADKPRIRWNWSRDDWNRQKHG